MDLSQIKPFVLNDFLSDEVIASVYKTINDKIKSNLDKHNDPWAEEFNKLQSNGFIAYFDNFEFETIKQIQNAIEMAIGHKIKRPGVIFARYTLESGRNPRLRPHIDRAMKNPAITCTVELNATLDWDIYVEDEKFNLENNDALFFSGSYQPHWRPDQKFEESDYFDILLCQSTLELEDDVELTDEFFDKQDKVSISYAHKYMDLLKESLSGPETGRE